MASKGGLFFKSKTVVPQCGASMEVTAIFVTNSPCINEKEPKCVGKLAVWIFKKWGFQNLPPFLGAKTDH